MRRRDALAAGVAVVLVVVGFLLLALPGGGPPPGFPPEGPERPSAPRPARPPQVSPPESAPAGAPAAAAPVPPAVPPAVPSAENEASPSVVLAGRVVGLRDEGIEGAQVALFRGKDLSAAPTGPLRELVAGRGVVALPYRTVASGPEGEFRIAAPKGTVATLLASAGGWGSAALERVLFTEDRDGIVLRLASTEALAGQVFRFPSIPGNPVTPVQGASVLLLDETSETRGRRLENPWRVLAAATTDAGGRFSIPEAPRGTHTLVATAPGLLPGVLPEFRVPAAERRPLDLYLHPVRLEALRGRISLPENGGPAEGARVRVLTHPGGVLDPWEAEARADDGGVYSLEIEVDPALAVQFLQVEARDGTRGAAVATRYDWRPGIDEDLILTPPPSIALRGRVVEAGAGGADRAGVEGVHLRASGEWVFPVECTAVSGPDGGFVLQGVPETKVRVGLAPDEGRVRYPPWGKVLEFDRLARDPDPVVIEVVASPAPGEGADRAPSRVSGAVIGPEGRPVPGALVSGFGKGAVIADRNGCFALEAVIGVETKVILRAEAAGFLPATAGPMGLFPETELRNTAIFFKASVGALAGRVVDGEGRPLGGVRVSIETAVAAGQTARRRTDLLEAATTRADGSYRFEVPAGTAWRVSASRPGCRDAVLDDALPGPLLPDLVLGPAPAPDPAPR